jgi:DNA polymerase-3 subunit epsilon
MSAQSSQRYIRAERRRYRRAQAGREWSVRDLPQFYYHKNFCELIETVEAAFPRLLAETDRRFLHDFRALPHAAQCAYVRLCGRKGHLFHTDTFNYPEIDDIAEQYQRLHRADFVQAPESQHFKAYLQSLAKPALTLLISDHVCETRYKKSWKKAVLVDVALDGIDFDDLTVRPTTFVQGRTETLDYLLYLYFGKIGQSLQNLTLRDLGLVKQSKLDRRYGARFDCRESAKTAYFYACGLHRFREEDGSAIEHLVQSLDTWPTPICSQSTGDRDKLLQKLGGLAERKGEVDTALSLYTRSDTTRCNERVVRLRYKQGDKDWAKTRLEAMIENPSSDEEHAFAQDFYARKYKKKRTSIVTDILREAETLHLDEAFRNQPERAALQHYRQKGLEGYRTENVPWRNLFGLLFWEELFADGVTRQLPQTLRDGVFYQTHETAIEANLATLDEPPVVLMHLLKSLTRHFGTDQAIVHWGSRSLERLKALITHAPKGAVAHMLRLMAKDWRGTKDGFPDLMLVKDGVAGFIEIKATGDVIRRNQLTRLRQLRAAGFRADILQVAWTVDPDQTYVVVDVETTGGRAGLHRVTEIGAVKMRGGQIIGEWSSLINPQRHIPANITRITGITDEMVADAPVFAQVADSFADFMGDAIFAAHNVNFDYGFISAEYQMIDRRFRHPKICTCSSMRKLYPGHASYSLKNLCREFHIDLKSHHRALCDAKAAAELLQLVNEKRLEDSAD